MWCGGRRLQGELISSLCQGGKRWGVERKGKSLRTKLGKGERGDGVCTGVRNLRKVLRLNFVSRLGFESGNRDWVDGHVGEWVVSA